VGGSLLSGTSGYSGPEKKKLYRDAHPVVARGLTEALRRDGRPGDWDQGFGNTEDGAFINKPDESNASKKYWNWGGNYHSGGYFRRGNFDIDPDGNNHAPNRQIASAVQFGSLPTGIYSMRPWETLLFCPNPAGRVTDAGSEPQAEDHIGFSFPRDHLLLDLFWMPVTQPYAISEPFSTAGKVNMNYEILPFSYIHRRTAILSALESVSVIAIPEIALARHPYGCIKGGRDQAHRLEVRYGVSTDEETGTLKNALHRETYFARLPKSAKSIWFRSQWNLEIPPRQLPLPENTNRCRIGGTSFEPQETMLGRCPTTSSIPG
jgi:uncharacterized protein (TIGR02600 family)